MSFILDALKKAESERHRATGPVLVDVRIAPRRRILPAWAWVLGAVLLVNLAVLLWLLMRKPAGMTAVNPAAPVAGTTPAAIPTVVIAPPGTTAVPVPTQTAPQATMPPSMAAPASAPAPASLAAQYASPPSTISPPVDAGSLPTLQDLQSAGVSLPPLLLNLHVYDPSPALRYVLLNGVRLGEGDFTPDGIKVEVITEHGVVLQARGRRFLLPAGG